MPKRSKLELDFYRKRLYPFLLERPNTNKIIQIFERLLNSLLKAKSSFRRQEYREKLEKVIKNLAVQSEDLLELQEKHKILQKKYSNLQEKASKIFQQSIKDKP